jgi:elongator complex protein 2
LSGVWVDAARMGEAGGTYTNGLFGGLFSSDGTLVLAHGFHGAFFLWQRDVGDTDKLDSGVVSAVGQRWSPRVASTGHFEGVRDLGWDPTGTCLFSTSDDQTVSGF